jgi:hypothetical protein
MEKKEGDDTGMQTRVWGPAGWIFLHSIAQNYPWEPSAEKKENYKLFFRLIGEVLPCRYCRESYQHFIKEQGTCLDDSVLQDRKTLTEWLYKIHNKVNKKLGEKNIPTFKETWNKYESYRSKCTKSPEIREKIQKGCLDPLKGYRKKCIFKVINVDSNGHPLEKVSFGKPKGSKRNSGSKKTRGSKKIRLISIKKSNRSGKKLMATFETNGRKKIIHFGAAGMSDLTKHHDRARRQRYITRHRKDLKTGNPARAGYLSMFVLWNKPSLQASIADYRRRLNVYNRTGKFPTNF